MADLTAQDMAAKLLADAFERSGPDARTLSDPLADTPMTVTLDELQPYDLNPRVTRNPRYAEIKASIRERGLDAPPAITRRPGDAHYTIRNGGNTRLAILRELWSETRDSRFYRIPCLFRPWPARGEIVALTGHLAENELHGGLSFVERALGVEKARELYEQEAGRALTQSELARHLTADGYPINQPLISRMQDAVRYLLPAIPTVLYGGLGRPPVERLTALRRAAARIWEARSASDHAAIDFPSLFQEVLARFDHDVDAFSIPRVRDELIGEMAAALRADYDLLSLELAEAESRHRALAAEPAPSSTDATAAQTAAQPSSPARDASAGPGGPAPAVQAPPRQTPKVSAPPPPERPEPSGDTPQDDPAAQLHGHIVSAAPTTERLQAIQRLVADQTGDALPSFETNVVQAIPVQAGGLYPISDVWYIEPGLDTPDRLRVHIAQLAREIADEAGQAERVEAVDDGIGFVSAADTPATDLHTATFAARAVLTLLHALSAGYQPAASMPTALANVRLADALGPLLLGWRDGPLQAARMSDASVVKLFRLIRLARRLLDLERPAEPDDDSASLA